MKRLLMLGLLAIAFVNPLRAAPGAGQYLKKTDEWFRSDEGRRIAANILSYQSPQGDWPKNLDTTAKPYDGKPEDLHGTFDNSATTDELRFLSRALNATGDAKYKAPFLKGLDVILKAQYPTGGWPQSYPPRKDYPRYITFNDNAMVRLMIFLREIATQKPYEFVDAARRQAAQKAFDAGVECILKCQVKVNGKLTVWCAQHDEKTYEPRPARKFELVSLSGAELVGITRLLMSLDKPKPEVAQAIEAAALWFNAAKLTGIRVEKKDDKTAPKGYDLVVVQDANAPPLWARFYDIATNKPFFVDRDSVPKPSIAEIGYERRTGYAWYGNWPQALLEKEYPEWKQKWAH